MSFYLLIMDIGVLISQSFKWYRCASTTINKLHTKVQKEIIPGIIYSLNLYRKSENIYFILEKKKMQENY